MLTVERFHQQQFFQPQQQPQQQGYFYSASIYPPKPPSSSTASAYGSSASTSSSASTTPQRRHSADSLAEAGPSNVSSSSWALMEKEVRAGAAWWRAKIREISASVSIVQLDVFEKALVRAIASKYEGHWYVEEPSRGCAFRAIVSDYGSDQTIKHALNAAKITIDYEKTPTFATMWINPGRVSVRLGKSLWDDDAEVVILFPSA